MTLNEEKFHDPHLFKPERFLPKPIGAGEEFPHNAIFGWGRRYALASDPSYKYAILNHKQYMHRSILCGKHGLARNR